MPSLVEIGLVVLKKKTKMLKVYDNDGQRTNYSFEPYNGDQKSSIELSDQVTLKLVCFSEISSR